jgi:hypothetical protein
MLGLILIALGVIVYSVLGMTSEPAGSVKRLHHKRKAVQAGMNLAGYAIYLVCAFVVFFAIAMFRVKTGI